MIFMDSSEFNSQPLASKSERTPPRERFAGGAVQFDLKATAEQLEAESREGHSGHRQIALYKHEKSTIALFRFEKGGAMPDHKAKGTVFVQVLEGKLTLRVEGSEHVLEAGGLLVLAPGVEHDVNAHETTVMLLTVCLDH
jgi:quercetin dioxygenase-like cupin family protein